MTFVAMLHFIATLTDKPSIKHNSGFTQFQFNFHQLADQDPANVITTKSTVEAAERAFNHPVMSQIIKVTTKLVI